MSDQPEQVVIRIESTDLQVAPGSNISVPLFLHNQSLEDGFFPWRCPAFPAIGYRFHCRWFA